MSKFNHKADLSKIFYISTMIEFMRAIQVSVQNGYTYYFYDEFEINKLESVLGKLDRNTTFQMVEWIVVEDIMNITEQ